MEAGVIRARGSRAGGVSLTQFCGGGVLLTGATLLTCVAALLSLRRLAGALATPLSPAALVITAVMLTLLAATVRSFLVVARRDHGNFRRTQFGVAWLAPGAAVVLAGWAVSLPGTSALGLWLLWATIAVEEAVGWGLAFCLRRDGPRNAAAATVAAVGSTTMPPPGMRFDHAELPEPHVLPEDVSQRMERAQTDDDHDVCYGHVRSSFQQGQRTDTVHIAFCPPFLATPELHVEQVDGPDAEIKSTQVLPYGARIEVRLKQANTQPVQTVVEFSAVG